MNGEQSAFVIGLADNPMSECGAKEFVDSVMAVNKVVNNEDVQLTEGMASRITKAIVHTVPEIKHSEKSNATPRKRALSGESDDENQSSEAKKLKRSSPPIPSEGPALPTTHFDALVGMISDLSANVMSVATRLEKRISDIEGNIEKRLTVKFNTVISDRIQNEVGKFKEECNDEIQNIKMKVDKIEKSYADVVASTPKECAQKDQINLNFIVKNLAYDKREDNNKKVLHSKVESLMKDGLKVSNVIIKEVNRKSSHQENKPGIVIVTVENIDQKKSVLKAKSSLKKASKFEKVFIENDLPLCRVYTLTYSSGVCLAYEKRKHAIRTLIVLAVFQLPIIAVTCLKRASNELWTCMKRVKAYVWRSRNVCWRMQSVHRTIMWRIRLYAEHMGVL